MTQEEKKFQKVIDRIAKEDHDANRSESFSVGRVLAFDEEDDGLAWDYAQWACFCKQTGNDLKDVLEGVTFQKAINEAVKNAVAMGRI